MAKRQEREGVDRRYGAELFNLLVETVEDYAIFAMDREGRIVHWNVGAARTLGFDADEVLGKPLDAIFCPEDREAGLPAYELAQAIETGRVEDERWHMRKDGSRFWAHGIVVPIRGSDGSIHGFGKILRDRTDLKELQETLQNRSENLREADERKNRFIATLAHELRNPLAPLVNAVELLRSHERAVPDLAPVARMMERQVAHLRRLVEDLLDISRISRGKLELRRQRIELDAALARAAEVARPLIEGRGCELLVMSPPAPVVFMADPDRLQQVLVNLLDNAAKFTPRGGRVTATGESTHGEVVIRVVDTGIGLPPDRLADIFEVFAQAHPALDDAHGGLGIGLALVRDLVALHGGTVQAWSAGRDKGSQFTVRLPHHGS